jgi:hypothetical protein
MKGMCYIEPLFYKVEYGSKTEMREIFKGNPKYKVGDTVYLKEPYYIDPSEMNGCNILYKFEKDINGIKWKNKLFMPEFAARLFIEITEVRAERLQEISEEDCIKEGIESFTKDEKLFKYSLDGCGWSEMPRTAREAYAVLIDHINGKGTWNSNPWVYVYEFKLYDRTWEYSQSRG